MTQSMLMKTKRSIKSILMILQLLVLLFTTTLGMSSQAQTVTYIHTDGLGSPVAKSDANGNLIVGSRTRYEPYGMAVAGTAAPTIGFTGHVNDADTGLTYMQQRYYDPVAGRFLSEDPVLTDSNSGASFNRYVYASNNPYKYIDPDGRADCKVDANGCKHYGNPQKTGTPGHDTASAKIGAQFSKQGATEVHYNRSLSAVTGDPAAGNQRPDVAAVMSNKSVSTVEVVSPSQTVASQAAKGQTMQSQLNSIGRAGNANTVTIQQGLTGTAAVRSIGAISILSPLVRAFELNQMGKEAGSPIPVSIGVHYMGGTMTREQVIDAVRGPIL